jgi:hypothetical protein
MTLSTPPEEKEKREHTVTLVVKNIKNIKVECSKLYVKITFIWTQLTEDVEL